MLFKTQLFHLGDLSPRSIPESNAIVKLIESISVEAIYHQGNLLEQEDLYIFYNRVPVDMIQVGSLIDVYYLEHENEIRLLKYSIERAILDSVDAYRVKHLTHPTRSRGGDAVLNIETCLLNRTTVAISFDCFKGGWNDAHVRSF